MRRVFTCLCLKLTGMNSTIQHSAIKDSLLEVSIDFALIRATIQKYVENRRYARLYIEAKSKFKNHLQNYR